MAIEEDGGLPGRVQRVGIDDRMPLCLKNLNVLHADLTEMRGDPLGTAYDVGLIFRVCADARYGDEFFQLIEIARLIRLDVPKDCFHSPVVVEVFPMKKIASQYNKARMDLQGADSLKVRRIFGIFTSTATCGD